MFIGTYGEKHTLSHTHTQDPKHFLVAVESGVDIFEWGVGPMRRVWDYPDRPEGVRLNDGRCDRQGRFIFGGYHPRNADDTESGKLARVFRLDKDFTGQPLFGDLRVRVTNSICFSPDGCTMYFCDSPDRKLLAYEYETATGVPKNPKLLRDFGADNLGFPDGSTVDSQGGIWTTVFGGWKVQRHDPQTGEADWTVKLPVPNPTCVAIGGENMDLLFITTTRKRMIADQLLKMPTSGGVFVVKLPGNSRGIHEPIFGVQ
eukprot:comp12071_c0_seq1/m.6796 comp12071_c0_seq1/g.6796  ORF comp12071_c0_seq1/g.6796 comp12071_c0_seq1/m.6796 type:complete len:259 (-) comp12071_c0_seq1:165-941(-)